MFLTTSIKLTLTTTSFSTPSGGNSHTHHISRLNIRKHIAYVFFQRHKTVDLQYMLLRIWPPQLLIANAHPEIMV